MSAIGDLLKTGTEMSAGALKMVVSGLANFWNGAMGNDPQVAALVNPVADGANKIIDGVASAGADATLRLFENISHGLPPAANVASRDTGQGRGMS